MAQRSSGVFFVGRTRQEIEAALEGKTRAELLDLIYRLATFEPVLTPREIASASRVNRREVLRDMSAGKFVDPLFGGGFFYRGASSKKVTISAANAWRRSFFVPVTVNGNSKRE